MLFRLFIFTFGSVFFFFSGEKEKENEQTKSEIYSEERLETCGYRRFFCSKDFFDSRFLL